MIRTLVAACLCVLPVLHAAGPGERALAFLEALREDEPDWQGESAIIEGTTREKRRAIGGRLETLGNQLEKGALRVLEERTADSLAAVLVAQVVEGDPSSAQVHAVALIRRDERWLPAPLPASFDNTGIRYVPDLAGKARELEDWMLRERARRLAELRETLRGRLLADIRGTTTRDALFEGPPEKLVTDFIAACRRHDLAAALAFLGGLEDPLPDDWDQTVALMADALSRPSGTPGAWDTLLAPAVMRVVMHVETEAESATVSLGEFDPVQDPPGLELWRVRHVRLDRNDAGFWRLRLPDWLTRDGSEHRGPRALDSEMHAAVPGKLLAAGDAIRPDTAEKLATIVLDALAASGPERLFRTLAAVGDDRAADALRGFSRLWRRYQDGDPEPLRLDLETDAETAILLFGDFAPDRPEIPPSRIRRLKFERESEGWALAPLANPDLDADFPPVLALRAERAQQRDQAAWLEELGLETRLGGLPAGDAPALEATRDTARRWLDALAAGRPRAILAETTAFDDDTGLKRLLDYLGRELAGGCTFEIVATHRHGRWAAASVRHTPPDPDQAPTDLLHPVVNTPKGPKILPEAILYRPATRSREFLNDSVWKRLAGRLPEAAVNELKQLHEDHNQLAPPEPD